MSAPSTIQHKRVFLGNIENIPSSVLRQTTPIKKKEASIPIVPPVISNSDVLLSTEESKPSPQAKPSHSLASGSTTPRYCYTREFILMFKDLPHCMAPPNPSPLEILKKYNEEHEFSLLREKLVEAQSHNQRSSAHHQQQNHHRAHNSAPSSSNSSPANNVTSLTDKATFPTVSTVNTDHHVIPLRMNKHSKEISTKPMFSPARRQSSTPIIPPTSFTVVDNKENLPFVSKEKRSVVGLGVKSPHGTSTSSVVSLKNGTIPSPRFAVKPKPDIYDPLEQTVAQHLIPTTPPASSVSLFNTPITPFPGPTPNNTPVRGLLPSPATTTTSVVSPSILALFPVSMLPPNTPLCAVLVPPPSSSSSPMATLSSPTFTQLFTTLPASPSPYIVSLSPSTPNSKISNINVHNGTSPSTSTTAVPTGEALDVITARMKGVLRETDPKRLVNRQKQIDYGKATVGYTRYCEIIPKSKRKREDPKTPNRFQICSKRSWDGQIRKWRRLLHLFDPESSKLDAELDCEDLEGDDDDDVDSNSDEQNTSTIIANDVDAVEVNIDTTTAV